MKKVCIVVSTLFTAKAFLLDQIDHLSRRYEVTVAANVTHDATDDTLFRGTPVKLAHVPLERRISLASDWRALVVLYRVFRKGRFDAVHSFTPKAGLVAMLAGVAARVPVRTHTFTGQVWATRTGFARLALKTLDRLMVAGTTHVLVDSASQRAFLRGEGVLSENQGEVLARGSVSGVDVERFRPDAAARASTRVELSIPADAIVFVFVGRLGRDKGVIDLARAFESLARTEKNVYLVLVGPDEEGLEPAIKAAAAEAASRLRVVGMTDAPQRYLGAGDVFCLPSYREGFGSAVIEAAAAGLPAIGTRIYGIVDAIEDGVTGLLVPPGDTAALAAAMQRLASDEGARRTLGDAARRRALSDFSRENLTSAVMAFYERVLPGSVPRMQEPARRPFD